MRIPGVKAVGFSLRWLRSRFVQHALILGYHRVTDFAQDTYSLCVTPRNFHDHLEVLRQAANPVSLRHLVGHLRDGRLPRRAVAITLDDGYADSLHCAKPLLESHGVPATVFVTSGLLGKEPWWYRLARLIESTPNLPDPWTLSIHSRQWDRALQSAGRARDDGHEWKEKVVLALYELLLQASPENRQRVLSELSTETGSPSNHESDARCLTREELVELHSGDLVDIGSHSVTHPLLARCSRAEQESEIFRSRAELEEILGTRVTGFSYPNGSWSSESLTLVQASGYDFACTSFSDVLTKRTDRYRLPRFWIPDWSGEEFSSWLDRWLNR